MQPGLPGSCGMVPSNFEAKTGNAAKNQGGWCGFKRPYILDPNSEAFTTMAKHYYAILKEVMGTSEYYSMDPFHEGANTDGIDVAAAYEAIYNAMKAANESIDEKWVIQFWQWIFCRSFRLRVWGRVWCWVCFCGWGVLWAFRTCVVCLQARPPTVAGRLHL